MAQAKRAGKPRLVRRVLSTHDRIANVFSGRVKHTPLQNIRSARDKAFTIRAEVTGVAMTE